MICDCRGVNGLPNGFDISRCGRLTGLRQCRQILDRPLSEKSKKSAPQRQQFLRDAEQIESSEFCMAIFFDQTMYLGFLPRFSVNVKIPKQIVVPIPPFGRTFC